MNAVGGIPAYYWTIDSGVLPDGLSLDSFTGTISVTPKESGTFEFTIRVRDNTEGNPGVTHTTTLNIGAGVSDRAALVALYNATDGPNWTNNTHWLSDRPIGEWHGVTTDATGRVVELSLRDNQLSGQIPAELGSLASLQSLDLKANRLFGRIPAWLGSLTNLEMLNLSWNRLSGEIPSKLGSLSKLQKLYLGSTWISGGIPAELGNLTNLTELWLGNGLDLTGELPPELSRLTKLEVLDLGRSEMSGPVPAWLGDLTRLRYLWLNGNEFAGEVPVELGNLTRLRLLTLDGNSGMLGALPGGLTKITGLYKLRFHDTGLCAPLDESFHAWLRKISDRQGPDCRPASSDRMIVRDMFGREVNETGIVLVDWEGHIANPAIKYSVELPGATAILSSTEPRLYFNLPSLVGANGPTKALVSEDPTQATEFYISIFPDRDTLDEKHTLTIRYMVGERQVRSQAIDVHVIDQDIDRPLEFNVITDFRHDKTGMFDDQWARTTVQQALDDWAYFIGDMNLDEVRAGDELMWIRDPDGSGRHVTNALDYTGYLMNVYGKVTGVATGGPSCDKRNPNQSSGGVELLIPRSGSLSFNPNLTWSARRWMAYEEWWQAHNRGSAPRDLYAGTLHEGGHALVFMGSNCHDGFAPFYEAREVRDAAVKAYYGSYPRMDRYGHLVEGTIDPASRRGGFGREFQGETPRGQALVTKLDLLIAQAAGYTLRDTTPFRDLSLPDEPLAEGSTGTFYTHTMNAVGGIPAYYWTIDSGTLPGGLSLDSFTGTISGTPQESGTFELTIRVRDNTEGNPGVTHTTTLNIGEGVSATPTPSPTATPTPVPTATPTPTPTPSEPDNGTAGGGDDSVCVTGGAVPSGSAALIADCETLLGMKSALRGSAKLNWWAGRSIEKWNGIKIQGGRVVELSLPNRKLGRRPPRRSRQPDGPEYARPERQQPDGDDTRVAEQPDRSDQMAACRQQLQRVHSVQPRADERQ